jgi:hypothetical protein
MTEARRHDAIIDLLGAIELRELRSLQWGFVDGSLREVEVDALAQDVAPDIAAKSDELAEELISRRLIFEVGSAEAGARYRSRFGEGVRLLVHLRQLFDGRPWPSAPRLVSDYRVDASPRRFPRRDLDPEAALEGLRQTPAWSDTRERLASQVLRGGAKPVHLSGFQLRVAKQLLAADSNARGVIVTAGTGSGKTLAFYLPALLEVGRLAEPGQQWTKCVAVYPRIELLKDQFSEVFRLFRSVDTVLRDGGRRLLTLGTLFSLTPQRARVDDVVAAGWLRFGAHFVCPFLRCPVCGSDMIWRHEDLERGVERLECTDGPRCPGVITEAEVVLSRRRMLAQPPDFVFTTIETLNQRLSDPGYRACLGIARPESRRLRFVLLDEVHTYAGTQGAHAAFVIRRWRHALGSSASFVGLSATLREAPRFFAELTGVSDRGVSEIAPLDEEYEERGMAYQLVLRGDPGARTALLSTSIQAGFLLPRLLDPQASAGTIGPSHGVFGRRVFMFTDDLDITNRLFDDLRDAEAYDHFGNPDPSRTPLASLRSTGAPDQHSRAQDGQRWDACERIGHDLSRRLGVTRTTSQDAGVSAGSEVVVATSALEVGFNDPQVGAIIQHKSPRSLAAFLQRKGRAGRTTAMRPWMITVLSDYGRDRLTFQAYERLLDPYLPPQRLPMRNRYVMRMQAVFAFIDWLANVSPSEVSGWWWWPLNGPSERAFVRRQQEWLETAIGELLNGDARRNHSLREHLRRALALDDDREIDELLWGPPRSLLLEVLPTLSRRLRTQWVAAGIDRPKFDLHKAGGAPHPLPDFLPANLFSDLNLPEVTVVVPPATRRNTERQESLPVLQALRLLVPGRVTRRFAHERGGLNHWLPVPLDAHEVAMSIAEYAEQSEFVADVPVRVDGAVAQIPCYRPWTVRLQRAPGHVRATSNAELHWLSRLVPTADPVRLAVGASTQWRRVIGDIEFFLHSRRASVTVQRYAHQGEARIRTLGREDDHVVAVTISDTDGSPAAVGFEQEVDGLRVSLRLPSPTELERTVQGRPEVSEWRAAYFRDLVRHDPDLVRSANRFQRDWLHQIYLAALLVEAARNDVTLDQASAQLHGKGVAQSCRVVMDQLFRFDPIAAESLDVRQGDESDEVPGLNESPRLVRSLAPLFDDTSVVARIERLAAVLWSDSTGAEFSTWLRARVADTVGEAVALACSYLAPEFATTDALTLDVVSPRSGEQDPSDLEVWITESIMGGAGILDAIGRGYAADPSAFARALDAALAASDLEVVASNLDLVLTLLHQDPAVAEAAQAVRSRDDHATREAARAALYALLAQRGIAVDHSLSVALNLRLLRRGASSESDRLLFELRSNWRALEVRYGIHVDLRTFAYLAAIHPTFGDRLREMVMKVAGHSPAVPEIVGVLSGILWPSGGEVRGRSLESHSPFRETGRADPALVRILLEGTEAIVEFGTDGWETTLAETLSERGAALLQAGREREGELSAAIYRTLAKPIDCGFLQFYPSIDRLQRDGESISVRLVVRELA